tara:strand:- start:1642 stop:2100 length:459 start_codon:yes stop_codon:yes gene_type:complete
MAKVTKALSVNELADLMRGKVKFDENHQIEKEPVVKVFEDNLPNDWTMTDVTTFTDYTKNFMGAYGEVGGTALAELVKANENIEAIEAVVDCGGVSFGNFFSRPMNEDPTEEDFAASFGFGIALPKPTELESKIRPALGKIFLNDDEDEDEE